MIQSFIFDKPQHILTLQQLLMNRETCLGQFGRETKVVIATYYLIKEKTKDIELTRKTMTWI